MKSIVCFIIGIIVSLSLLVEASRHRSLGRPHSNTTNVECPAIECPDDIRCEHGYLTELNGCMTCECRNSSLPTSPSRKGRNQQNCPAFLCRMNCQFGFKTDANNCQTCECKTKEEVCGNAMCLMHCDNGFQKDHRGCDKCVCRDASSSYFSSSDSSSSSSFRYSNRNRQNRRGSNSSKKCDRIQCTMFCDHGYKQDNQGCRLCQCNDAPPSAPHSRILQSSSGRGTSGRGSSRSDSQRNATCSVKSCHQGRRCLHGFVKDSVGCDTCRCSTRRQSSSSRCGEGAMCLNYCEHGRKLGRDGCPTCDCKDAPANQAPANEARAPQKVCAVCMMFCSNGFKMGPDGCPLCECNE